MLRTELHPYTEAIREAGERIGKAMEAGRRKHWWALPNEDAKRDLAVAWWDYGKACEALYSKLEQ